VTHRRGRATPPGPSGRPSLEQLKTLRQGPHEFLLALTREYGHAVRYPVGPFRFHLFTDPDAVQHVLVGNHGNYAKDTFQYRLLSRITGDGLLTMDGPEWLARRRLAQPSFHRARVSEFAPTFTRYAGELVERWEEPCRTGTPIDVAGAMMHVALQAVVKTLFGAEVGDRAGPLWRAALDVLHHIMFQARTLGIVPPWLPTSGNRRFRRALAVLDEAIYGTIHDRRREGAAASSTRTDLLQRLIDAESEEGGLALTDRQLRDEMMTLLIAGHETVASALTWTWHLLAITPDADTALYTEVRDVVGDRVPVGDDLPRLVYTRAAFEEAMRLYPPAWVITRRALVDDEIQGHSVPRGALVVLSPYVTQRHPDSWERPERFEPARFLPGADSDRHRYAYFPFGGGPHLCIGNHFALVEATLMIATIARRYRLEPVPGHGVEVDPGVTLQPKGGLPMLVRRRIFEP
jgi:cytochrome P450